MERISDFAAAFLLNAVWQIAVIAVVAWVCSYLLRDVAARYRHILWVAALLMSLALPLWGLIDFERAAQSQLAEQQINAASMQESLASSTQSLPTSEAITTVESSPALGHLLQKRRQTVVTAPVLSLALAIGFALFVLYRLGVLWRLWRRAERLRRSAYEREIPSHVSAVAARCRAALRLRNAPLMCSIKATVPVTIGAQKTVVILPEQFYAEQSDEVLVSVLGHEMAHVARRDYALNLIYELLLLPISFHPLAKFIKRQIDRTRELACDEIVTRRLLAPNAYARSIVHVASTLSAQPEEALTLGIFDADILEERIMTLTRNTRRLGQRAGRLLTLAAISLLCLSCLTISTFSFDLRSDGAHSRAAINPVQEAMEESADRDSSQAQTHVQERSASTPLLDDKTQGFHSNNAQERARAACDAGKRRTLESIPTLMSMLGDDSPIQPLKCWESGDWNPALQTFKQSSPGEEAAIALASMGTPALQPLTNALGDSNASVRRNAAWAIGELTNMRGGERDRAVPALISLLSDSDDWVRMAAARALGEIRDERAVVKLIDGLMDASWKVRELSAWALGEMKEEQAVEALCKMLLEDAQAEARETAAWALGEIADPKAAAFLNQALNDPEMRVRDKARWALSEIEDSDG